MIDQEQVLEILHAIGEKITEEKLYLTELDNVIGDGDHGINLARGFAEVEKKRPMMEGKDIGTMLKTAGMALVSTVGGASGPLYGTAFMQAGKALAGKTELDAQDLLTILDAFVAGAQLRARDERVQDREKILRVQLRLPGQRLARLHECRAVERPGRAADRRHEGHTGSLEHGADVLALHHRALFLNLGEAAGQIDPVVAVADDVVELGEI